jgi:DNA integrity scanning protein DisA with diadenylate cyclase activity
MMKTKMLNILFLVVLGYFTYCFVNLCFVLGGLAVPWLIEQITEFNVIMFVAIIIFTTSLSRANTVKLLKEQSQELYAEFEEIKDEIRGNTRK